MYILTQKGWIKNNPQYVHIILNFKFITQYNHTYNTGDITSQVYKKEKENGDTQKRTVCLFRKE